MYSRRLGTLAFVTAIGSLVWSPVGSLAADKPAAYTAGQAALGATLFSANCSRCHGADLQGIAAPPLAGSAFMGNWKGDTAADLYALMSTEMPQDRPGTLKPDQYLAILAFVLQRNGYPAGTAPLGPAQLRQITIAP